MNTTEFNGCFNVRREIVWELNIYRMNKKQIVLEYPTLELALNMAKESIREPPVTNDDAGFWPPSEGCWGEILEKEITIIDKVVTVIGEKPKEEKLTLAQKLAKNEEKFTLAQKLAKNKESGYEMALHGE